MSKIHGLNGAIYSAATYLIADTISFDGTDPYVITDAGSGFGSFAISDLIEVKSTSGTNDGEYTVSGKTAAALTVTESLTTETAATAGRVRVVKTAPGTTAAGFYSWKLDNGIEVKDCTDFNDGGVRKKLATLKDWSATADKFWLDNVTGLSSWLATEKWVRFFVYYTASPTVALPAAYYEGPAIITGISPNCPVDELITEPLTFTGTGLLYYVTRTTDWDT